MEDVVRLGPHEVVAGRPFCHPERSAPDVVAIRAMAAGLRHLLAEPLPAAPRPIWLDAPEVEGRPHRAVVCNDGVLRAAGDRTFVGFFATKRPAVDAAPLTAADDELIREFPRHPGVLSYSSLELPDGNWGNLIMFDAPEARDRWGTCEKHGRAVADLAPRHYSAIRLHNGIWPGGILSSQEPVLLRTKYLDFRDSPPWRAERTHAS